MQKLYFVKLITNLLILNLQTRWNPFSLFLAIGSTLNRSQPQDGITVHLIKLRRLNYEPSQPLIKTGTYPGR